MVGEPLEKIGYADKAASNIAVQILSYFKFMPSLDGTRRWSGYVLVKDTFKYNQLPLLSSALFMQH